MSSLPNILFVDDDANVLQGLRRMLYSLRQEWQMVFATSAEEALQKLAQAPFDVIVTDVRMPRMNGPQLLAEVRRRYPHTARFILSGQSDRELTVDAVGLAHQYLSKPCEPEVLKQAIRNVCTLQELMANEMVRRVVSRMQSVPSLPRIHARVLKELESDDVSLPRVGTLISQDAGMTAKILQVVNSSFFGLRRHYSNPEEAVVFLGVEILKALVLGVHVFSQFSEHDSPGVPFVSLWEHGLRACVVARMVATAAGLGKAGVEHSTTAALLHDVGTLALACCLPGEYAQVLAAVRGGAHQSAAELQVLGVTHAQAGAYLMGLWGLADPIVEAILLHHTPSVGTTPGVTPLAVVHVAEFLSHDPICLSDGPDPAFLRQLGLLDRVEEWRLGARDLVERMVNPRE